MPSLEGDEALDSGLTDAAEEAEATESDSEVGMEVEESEAVDAVTEAMALVRAEVEAEETKWKRGSGSCGASTGGS